ncbi:MAG: type II secretion system protein [Thermoanaerobacteraceae bacterium]|nr:type II secretion system protein [Thermoanaerobacteraceae bacterium]
MLKSQDGFTLLEVVVGVVILAVALVPLVDYLVVSSRWSASSEEELVALALAQGKIEEIKGRPLSEVRDEPENPGDPPLAFPENPSFRYRLTVDESGRYLKTVIVTVYYEDSWGSRQMSLTAEKGWR